MESFVLLPVMTISLPFGGIPKEDASVVAGPITVVSQEENTVLGLLSNNQVVNAETKILEAKGEAIDAYFRERDMPLLGYGKKLAMEAEKNDLDWRLLAAIAVRESTGGKFSCKKVENNPFGWGSCKIGFDSLNEAIETVARNLGGNNPNTAHHYADKNTKEILQKYNPPSIVKHYAEQVMKIMDTIGEAEITLNQNV